MIEVFLNLFREMLVTFQSFFRAAVEESGALSAASDTAPTLTYAEDGTLLSRLVQRPDGLQQEDAYTDGARSSMTLVDVLDDQPWQSIVNLYDETGRTEKVTTFDDGSLRTDTFLFGVRVRSVQIDPDDTGTQDWTSIDVSYGADGEPLSRLIRYDDGTARTDIFDDGDRIQASQEDLVLTARTWSQIETFYDVLGRLTGRDLSYDDGVIRTDQFSAGVRQKTSLVDDLDTSDWAQITYLYDPSGVVESRQQVDDNGDITLILFEDGQRSARVIHDVDDDMPWVVQVTNYDTSGVVDVTDYQDTDVLDDFSPYFAADDLVF